MILREINVRNFRNYDHLSLKLSPQINIVYGDNAQGKTNLLESIYVLGITKSHRSFIDHNLVNKDMLVAKIDGTLIDRDIPTHLQITIDQKNKKLEIDHHTIKKIGDYISKMNIIIFYPEDLELIKGTPAIRRRFLNLELSQLYGNYINILNDYQKLLKMRNEYLKKMSKGMVIDHEYFKIMTGYLIDKAILIYRMRKKFIDKINSYAEKIYEHLASIENFHIQYKTIPEFDSFEVDIMKQKLLEKFDHILPAEAKLGTTLMGPQRDDFDFEIEHENLKSYGSQGQQRLAVLAFKLSEIELFRQYRDSDPILLLDDVFSELDDQKKNNLLYYINKNIQTIITTTNLKNIRNDILKKSKLIKITDGKIMEEGEDNYGEK